MMARFGWGMRRYEREQITVEDARRIVRERLDRRAQNFLRLVERAVYGYPASPYLALLKRAGCEFSDLRAGVLRDGIERTLEKLRTGGVVVTFQQFKGRAPLECDGKIVADQARAFDNPFNASSFVAETSGSTGKGTRIAHDLDHQAEIASYHLLSRAAHGVLGAPFGIWRGILPDGSGINNVLHTIKFNQDPEVWFSHLGWRESKLPFASVLFTYWFVLAGRAAGAHIPFPQYVPLERADIVAQWAYDAVQTRGRALLSTQVSRALRVALAAQERGLDLTGVTMIIAGEPPTPAKVQAIRASGAHTYPTYGMAEVGRMAMGCANPLDSNDTHLMHDGFAVVPGQAAVQGFDGTVPAFYITTLLPSTPKLMLNVIGDDYGIMEERACGCLFDELGFHTHLREIRSVNKLTGEGITLVGTEMLNLLENVLPARFGGSPLDYQLQELEDARGFTRLALSISPRVQIADEGEVKRVMLEALSASSASGHVARVVWESADSLQIRRTEPVWTARGKMMPLHLVRSEPPTPEVTP